MAVRQPTLTDAVVMLTPYSLRDIDALVAANRDAEMALRFDFPPHPPTPEAARRAILGWQRGWRTRRLVAFAVRDPASRSLIGGCEIRVRRGRIANVSYFTIRNRRGQGVATGAVRLLAPFALTELGVDRLEILIEMDNAASHTVAERSGFMREGLLRQWGVTHRGRRDHVVYSMIRSDLDAIVNHTIEELAREGARRMLERALAVEVDEFLGRPRYERRMLAEHGYRNGYGRPRPVAIGTWPVEVRAPRIRDLPDDAPPFHSSILPRRRMLSAETQRLFARLYLEGLSSGDFEPAFRELLGEYATLSSSTILRLKEEWAFEYAAWRVRPLTARYAYIWSDGIYLGAGLEPEHSCLLVIVGAREDGRKELLAMELGYRESTESWAGVLRGLKARGLDAPLLACGDGALGLWAALDEVFPATRHQRCWNHRVLNILDKVPKRLWPDIRRRLREVWSAESRSECELRRDALLRWLEAHGQSAAADTVRRDWDDFVTFYDFPAEHWIHLRTSNPIESLFAGVRLRTDVAKRMRRRENALYLVFKIAQRLEHSWRPLNGGLTIMTLLLGGARFVDGVYVPAAEQVSAA